MTTTEVERLSRMLTDMRVENAGQFATLHERLSAVPQLTARVTLLEQAPPIPDLSDRVTLLEQASNSAGRFTWSDVFRAIAAGAALLAGAYTVTHWG